MAVVGYTPLPKESKETATIEIFTEIVKFTPAASYIKCYLKSSLSSFCIYKI
jgi:hypothetical protein